ncbi:peptidylprolyl isomerase [Mariniblastus sp.]|nr:peptidylprolyl isomerase [Mariniblastus sp.]
MRTPIVSARKRRSFCYQSLESRRLLAGNISIALAGDVLVVTGDELANQVNVAQNASGQVTFTGLDSTTVNGLTEFTFSDTFDRTRFELNGGADEVFANGFDAGREFRFLGGDGNDRLEANSLAARYFHVRGNAGNDAFRLTQSFSRKSAYFYLGDGNDVLAVESFDAGRNFKVFGEDGNDTFASNELSVDRKLRIDLGSGNDSALISGETSVRKNAKIRLGSGDDFLGVLPDLNAASATFQRSAFVDAGRGDDAVVLGLSSDFDRAAKFKGRSGFDSIDIAEAEFGRGAAIRQFENQAVENLDEILDQVFARLDEVGFDSIQFGNEQQQVESSIQIELSDTEVVYVENDPAIAVANDLVLQADAAESIVSATIQLQGGSDEDTLIFEDQNGISGTFDNETSNLALTGVASALDYQTAIASVLFESVGDNPSSDLRTITFSLQSELPFEPITASRTIRVTPIDDPIDLVLPAAFAGDAPVQQTVNQPFGFTVEDADPDNSVVYQLDLDQSGISATASQPTIDPDSGEFTWTPSEVGTFVVRVIATNDLGESDQEEFTVLIVDQVALSIAEIEDQTINFNEPLQIQVQATQGSIDLPLDFELEVSGDATDGTNNLPVISDDGLITWTPDLLTSGTAIINVIASDGNQATASETFEVDLPGFQPFLGNGQLASVDPIDRDGIFGDSFQGSGPPMTIDQSLDYTATISTEVGDLVVNLFADQTPISVNNFVNLTEDGFYDGLSFHRVVESAVVDDAGLPVLDENGDLQFERFVAQAGDPTNTSSGGPGYRINDEILSELTFDRRGILAYAKTSAPDTNGSQFFITYDATEFTNDENFTIFGEVVDFGEVIDGQDVLNRLNLTDPSDVDPATPTVINSISIATS